jgi:hypothetical protein
MTTYPRLRRLFPDHLYDTLVAALAVGSVAPTRASVAQLVGASSQASLTALLMQWFTEMQASRRPRALRPRLRSPNHRCGDLNKYGASPLRARKDGDQDFYIVKFIFPREMRPACCSASTRTARSSASPSAAWPGTDSVITAMT